MLMHLTRQQYRPVFEWDTVRIFLVGLVLNSTTLPDHVSDQPGRRGSASFLQGCACAFISARNFLIGSL
jgi:hypothetical protein